jgi:CheY-like chemotaxis protein
MGMSRPVKRGAWPNQKPAILVVDDDPDVRLTIRWALEEAGLQVATATDGRDALAQANERHPALVLLDSTMAPYNDVKVARKLRDLCGSRLPILTITASIDPSEKARRVGAIGYLQKPFNLDDLVGAVAQALAA